MLFPSPLKHHYKEKLVHTNSQGGIYPSSQHQKHSAIYSLKTSYYLTGWSNYEGNSTNHFFFICSAKYGTPTQVCKLLLIQKL